jgi:hypothetical protein
MFCVGRFLASRRARSARRSVILAFAHRFARRWRRWYFRGRTRRYWCRRYWRRRRWRRRRRLRLGQGGRHFEAQICRQAIPALRVRFGARRWRGGLAARFFALVLRVWDQFWHAYRCWQRLGRHFGAQLAGQFVPF